MRSFKDRQKGYEEEFKRNQELQFRVTARRNKLFGLWAAEKLGIGGGEPAVGYLLGEVHDGIRQMFDVIENARMLVGTKAIGTLSTGYLNALEYAKERVQGPDLTQAADKNAPKVTITHHPDVRRSLMTQKSYAEAMRALYVYTAYWKDQVLIGGENAELAAKINDLLLPIVKGYGSEKAWTLLGTESLQTLGGSGFLQEYPIEQYVRDAKIDTLYEGTTAIQGQDLFFRKIVKDPKTAEKLMPDHFVMTKRPITIRMPDLAQLLAQAVTRPRGALSNVRVVHAQQLQVKAKDQKAEGALGGAAICHFSIPLITIVAMFVLSLFLPIVVFIMQLWYLLAFRFCIPPQVSLGGGFKLAADLTAKLPEVDGKLQIAAVSSERPPITTTYSGAFGFPSPNTSRMKGPNASDAMISGMTMKKLNTPMYTPIRCGGRAVERIAYGIDRIDAHAMPTPTMLSRSTWRS